MIFFNILMIFFFSILSFSVTAQANNKDEVSGITDISVEQLMNIEVPTVNGACKFEQKITDAPSAVSIVTADEIKKYGYRTLADILRSVRGFYITYDRNYNYLGVRGFNRPGDLNSRILLLLDGHRLNDNIYDTATIGTEFPLDIDLIERVEIIRGPSSSLYGTSAFLAVINIISRQGKDMKGTEIAGSAGSQDTYSGRLSYGTKYRNGLEMLISGSGFQSSGAKGLYYREYDSPATNNGIADHGDGDKNYSFFSKFSFKDITLTGAYASRKKEIPTGSFGVIFNDDRNNTIDSHGFVDLKYLVSLNRKSDLTIRAFYDDYEYRGDYVYSGANPGDPPVINKDTASGRWAGLELMYVGRFGDDHLVTFGAEERYNFRQQQKNYDESPYSSKLDDNRTSDSYAFYFQDEYYFLSNLIFNIGVRHDHYSTFGGSTNPRLALIYKPVEKTIFKLLYGSAFRAPNAYELYYSDGGNTAKANTNLQPEKIKNYEIVYEQYLGEHWRSSLGGFYYQIDNLISQKTDPADGLLVFRNTDEVEGKGMEAEIEGRWSSGFQGKMSYTYSDVTDKATGEELTNSPHHLIKLNLIAPLLTRKLFAGMELQYTSSRKTKSGASESGFALANATLFSQNIFKGTEMSVTVFNILDKKYADPAAGEHLQDTIAQDGRRISAKLVYRF
jgi:iron complex outermembrane receptor protein